MDERSIPEQANRDPDSWELLRVWVAEQGLHCSMKVGVYEDHGPLPEDTVWGIVLADAARHLADALASMGLRDRNAALEEIKRSFSTELDNPTSDTSGDFTD